MRDKFIKYSIAVVLIAALSAGALAGCAPAAPPEKPAPEVPEVITWDNACYAPATTPDSVIIEEWTKEVEKRTNGRLKIKNHFNATLVGPMLQPEAVKAGLCQVTQFVHAYYPSKFVLAGVQIQPFVIPAAPEGTYVQDAINRHPAVVAEARDKWNAKYMFPAFSAQYNLIGKEAVRNFDDLQGVKIRTVGGYATMFNEAGAASVFTTSPEMYGALQTGIVDLICHSAYVAFSYKYIELSEYMALVDVGSTDYATYVNIDAYNALPDDIRKIVDEVSREWVDYSANEFKELRDDSIAKMREIEGFEIIEWSPGELAKLEEIAKEQVWPKWLAIAEEQGLPGQKILDFALAER